MKDRHGADVQDTGTPARGSRNSNDDTLPLSTLAVHALVGFFVVAISLVLIGIGWYVTGGWPGTLTRVAEDFTYGVGGVVVVFLSFAAVGSVTITVGGAVRRRYR